MKLQKVVKGYVQALVFGLSISAIGTGLYSTAEAADWPNYRGPNHDGITSETNWSANWPTSGPKQLWKKSIGIGFSSMTISNGRVYTMGNTGRKGDNKEHDIVFCLDANTGREIWTHIYPCPLQPKYYEGGTLSTPTVDGDVIYTISKMGHLFCLKAATGEVVWQKNMNQDYGFKLPTWHFSGSPLVMSEMLIFNLGTAGVALNKTNGQIIWENGKDVCGYATPVPYKMDGQQCIALCAADAIKGVKLDDGKLLWEYPFVNQHKVNPSDPIVVGNDVFASSGYNLGCVRVSINAGKAAKVWQNKNMRNHINCSMFWKGYIYGFDESRLRCIDFKDGSVKWTDGSMGKGALMMSADGRMIIISDRGELVIAKANPEKFEPISRSQILPKRKSWTTPILANGKIYARNANGDMVCVDVSN